MGEECCAAEHGEAREIDFGKAAVIAAGAVSALAVENLARQKFGRARTELAAAGLVTAAAIYPLARREARAGLESAREIASVVAAAALVVVAYRTPPGLRRRAVLGAAWVGHAVFDNVHHAGPGGTLPAWYADLCAGYDVAFAGALLRPSR
ncbi:MAG: hypothetical protein ACT4QF_23455 [Sporichthyaceae bacterium]